MNLRLVRGDKREDAPKVERLDDVIARLGRVHDYGDPPVLPHMVGLALPIVLKFAGKALEAVPESRARGQLESALEVCLAYFSTPYIEPDPANPYGIGRV